MNIGGQEELVLLKDLNTKVKVFCLFIVEI
jgi:hypothetical protein